MDLKERSSRDILLAFRGKHAELSTAEIASIVYSQEFAQVEKVLKGMGSTVQEARKAKSLKAKLHRRVLYHLNGLALKEFVRITRVDNRGEKYYQLDASGNEELVLEEYRKHKLMPPRIKPPLLPIEGYEEKKILVKFHGDGWLESANALLIDIDSLPTLNRTIPYLYNEVNDVLAIADFSKHANGSSGNGLVEFCKQLLQDSKDYGRWFSLLVDVSLLDQSGKRSLLEMLRHNAAADHSVKFIFETNPKEFNENLEFFEEVFRTYANRKVFLKNKEFSATPYFMGKSGPYTVAEEEWSSLNTKARALVFSQTTLMMDIKKFCETFSFSFNAFEDLTLKTVRSLFQSNTVQRRHTNTYFKNILRLGRSNEIFALSRNYVRFWNYDYLRLTYDHRVMEGLFRLIKKRAEEFCTAQETIYASCGMPVRFKAAFSTANTALSNDYFTTTLDRSRLEVSSMQDFYSDSFREHMKSKEALVDMFDGGFQLTVHKNGIFNPAEAAREANVLLGTYKVPFFAYMVNGPKGILKDLKSFGGVNDGDR